MVFCHFKQRSIRRFRLTKADNHGFTLLELLVALLMSGVVFAGLMTIIVNFLQIDRREAKLDQLQQDTQRAADFIADDLREAVFAYYQTVDDGSIDGDPLLLSELQPYINPGSTPVLALWRPVSIEDLDELANIEVDCDAVYGAGSDDSTECEILKARRASYSLVIYAHRDNAANDIWNGPARIERYELNKYDNLATNPFVQSDGFTDPTDADNANNFNQFETWPPAAGGSADIEVATLVDQIGLNYYAESGAGREFVQCDDLTGTAGVYTAVPTDATEDSAFYACVRNTNPEDPNDGVRSNQDVLLVVRGDARSETGARGETNTFDASDSYLNGASDRAKFPEIETRVLVGGGVNRGN